MKVKVKGLVFAGFAAMIFAANAMAANEDKTVTSKAFTEATYAKKANLKQTIDGTSATASVDFPSVAAVAGLVGDSYTGTAPVSVDAQTHVITVDVADAIASGETGLTTGGQVHTALADKEDVSNKTQTVAATGSTDDDKYPSETAVRAAITAVETAAATAYQDRSEAGEAQYVADGNGGWEALTKDTTVTSGSSNPVTSDAVYNAIQNSTGGLTIPAQNTNVCTAQHPCALVDVAGTLHWYTMAQDGYAGGELGDAQ